MKKYFIAAFFVAVTAITLVSCDFFIATKPEHSNNPLIGKWTIDSLSFGKDSNDLSIAYLFLAMSVQDSSRIHLEFAKDSLTTTENDETIEKSEYSFDNTTNRVYFNDSSQTTFLFSRISDSLISLSQKDSVAIFLRRQ